MLEPFELAVSVCDDLPALVSCHFADHVFDSRLEVSWCVFMHLLGVPYMPEGLEIRFRHNYIYTPDFFLPAAWADMTGAFLEIKGNVPDTAAISKAAMVPRHTSLPTVILAGSLGVPFRDHNRTTARCEVENPYRCHAWDRHGRAVPGMVWVMRDDARVHLAVVDDPSRDMGWAHPRLLLAYRTAARLTRGVVARHGQSRRCGE